jgi:hypothetical protein
VADVIAYAKGRLRDIRNAIEGDLVVEDHGAPLTCVVFSGIGLKLGMPVFEFRRTASHLPYNFILVRDSKNLWYHAGIRRTKSFDDTCALLRRHIDELGAPAFAVGNSAGGYAALLFGVRLGLAGVLASNPQTFMDAATRTAHGEGRWSGHAKRLHRRWPAPMDPAAELRQAATRPPTEVWYGAGDRLDVIHAERLRGIPGVTLHPVEAGDHFLVTELRDQGRLHTIIEDFAARFEPAVLSRA